MSGNIICKQLLFGNVLWFVLYLTMQSKLVNISLHKKRIRILPYFVLVSEFHLSYSGLTYASSILYPYSFIGLSYKFLKYGC
jgi:hypothetical protein